MIQLINPKNGNCYDCEVMVCREHFCEVVMRWNGATVRADYDNIRWVSKDWFNK